jgi:DNA-binding GntR family transcriptional regulator
VLARVVATLNERLAAEHQLVEPNDDPDQLAGGHDDIVDSLRRQDAEGAADAMRRHIDLGREVLSRHLRSAGLVDG